MKCGKMGCEKWRMATWICRWDYKQYRQSIVDCRYCLYHASIVRLVADDATKKTTEECSSCCASLNTTVATLLPNLPHLVVVALALSSTMGGICNLGKTTLAIVARKVIRYRSTTVRAVAQTSMVDKWLGNNCGVATLGTTR